MKARPRITIGIPVFGGKRFVAEAIATLQAQTFGDFSALISVDGRDEESAAVCRPFEADPRLRVVVQPERLGFAGNFDWLARQTETEFFVYLSQDDRLAPAFLETLTAAADAHPEALVVYPDLQWFEGMHSVRSEPELHGSAFDRVLSQVSQCHWLPIHGLARSQALALAGPLVSGSPDAIFEDVIWFTRLMRFGTALRVPSPLYEKRLHAEAISRKQAAWPRDRVWRAWRHAWARLLAEALPAAANPDQSGQILTAVSKRAALSSRDMAWFFDASRLGRAERRKLVTELLDHVPANMAIDLAAACHMKPDEIQRRCLQAVGLKPA